MSNDRGRPLPILLAEDSPEIQALTTTVLKFAGYEVVIAENGMQALTILRAGQPAGLILLDLAMPVMDGFGFRKEQLADPALREIPVIVCSAYLDAMPDVASLDARGYFRKDGNIDALLRLIDTHCLREPAHQAS